MTTQELKDLFAEISAQQKRVSAQQEKTDAQMKRTDEKLERKRDNLKKPFPVYSNFEVHASIAGMTIPQAVITDSKERGFHVLVAKGDHIEEVV